jgi:hypothetical protein
MERANGITVKRRTMHQCESRGRQLGEASNRGPGRWSQAPNETVLRKSGHVPRCRLTSTQAVTYGEKIAHFGSVRVVSSNSTRFPRMRYVQRVNMPDALSTRSGSSKF